MDTRIRRIEGVFEGQGGGSWVALRGVQSRRNLENVLSVERMLGECHAIVLCAGLCCVALCCESLPSTGFV